MAKKRKTSGMRKNSCRNIKTPSGMRRICKDGRGRVRFVKMSSRRGRR